MSSLRLRLFGEFQIQHHEQIQTDLLPRKLQELLCYLLLFRDRPHSRETLASLLWENSTTTRSKRNLRQALWQLRSSDVFQGVGHDLLLTDAHWIRLNLDAGLWLDIEAVEQAFSRLQGIPGHAIDANQAQAVVEAVNLYRGELLEGWFQDWCLLERERFQTIYICLMEKLMDYCEACGAYQAGLAHGMRILDCDTAREQTHQRLMRLHFLSGDRAAALRQYDRCVKELRRELDVSPARQTVALFQQIRASRPTSPHRVPPNQPLAPNSSSPEWSALLERLRWLQETLTGVQDELQDAIRVAERFETDHS